MAAALLRKTETRLTETSRQRAKNSSPADWAEILSAMPENSNTRIVRETLESERWPAGILPRMSSENSPRLEKKEQTMRMHNQVPRGTPQPEFRADLTSTQEQISYLISQIMGAYAWDWDWDKDGDKPYKAASYMLDREVGREAAAEWVAKQIEKLLIIEIQQTLLNLVADD